MSSHFIVRNIFRLLLSSREGPTVRLTFVRSLQFRLSHESGLISGEVYGIVKENASLIQQLQLVENLIDLSAYRNKKRATRQKKLSTRIDMTPMVDLAFLLVTFFILTTSLNKPKAMQMIMPEEGNSTVWRDSETVNLLIGNREIFWYPGNDIGVYKKIESNAIRKFLRETNNRILSLQHKKGWKENGVMILLKPFDQSRYEDLVNILDELKIQHINTYALVDPTPEEIKAIKK